MGISTNAAKKCSRSHHHRVGTLASVLGALVCAVALPASSAWRTPEKNSRLRREPMSLASLLGGGTMEQHGPHPQPHWAHIKKGPTLLSALEVQVESPRTAEETRKAVFALSTVTGGVLFGVTWIYWSRGWAVIMLTQIYIGLLVVISLWVKAIYKEFHYHYPIFITVTHLVLTGGVCRIYVMWRRRTTQAELVEDDKSAEIGFWQRALQIWPVAFAQALSIVARNTALDHASVSMVEMLSSSTPLVTITISTVMGEKFGTSQWGAVILVCMGTAAMLHGDKALAADLTGVFLVFAANITRSLKGVLQSKLVQGANGRRQQDPWDLWAEMAPPCVVLLVVLSAVYEGLGPFRDYYKLGLLGNIFLFASCITACCLNLCGLQMMKQIGATGTHIVGSLKIALTVFVSILLFHESVLVMQIVGTMLAMVGAWAFSHKPATPAALPANKPAATTKP